MATFTYKVFCTPAMKTCNLNTHSWQEAIDEWSSFKAKGFNSIIHLFGNGIDRIITTSDSIKNWSEYLLENKYNRVEKRLMKELQEQESDGMEIVEPKDDLRFRNEIPDLMCKIYGGSKEIKANLKDIDFHGKFEDMSCQEQNDIINPKHYRMIPKEAYDRFPEGLEYMDLMEYILKDHKGVESHLLGQIFKYACRLGKKDAKLQDARKIEWYASRLVEVIEDDK